MNKSVLHLLHLSDPSLPIGGFSHSGGLETYVQHGIVKDKASLFDFTAQQVSENLFYTDGTLLSLAYDAALNNDLERIVHLDELCNAVKLTKEIRTASQKLAMRLLKNFEPYFRSTILSKYYNSIISKKSFGHYCISFALIANSYSIDKHEALAGFYYNAANGFITNGVKLIPLGQQDGQSILIQLLPLIDQLVGASLQPDESLVGYCCNGFDIRSMQHEVLWTRLYMS